MERIQVRSDQFKADSKLSVKFSGVGLNLESLLQGAI